MKRKKVYKSVHEWSNKLIKYAEFCYEIGGYEIDFLRPNYYKLLGIVDLLSEGKTFIFNNIAIKYESA